MLARLPILIALVFGALLVALSASSANKARPEAGEQRWTESQLRLARSLREEIAKNPYFAGREGDRFSDPMRFSAAHLVNLFRVRAAHRFPKASDPLSRYAQLFEEMGPILRDPARAHRALEDQALSRAVLELFKEVEWYNTAFRSDAEARTATYELWMMHPANWNKVKPLLAGVLSEQLGRTKPLYLRVTGLAESDEFIELTECVDDLLAEPDWLPAAQQEEYMALPRDHRAPALANALGLRFCLSDKDSEVLAKAEKVIKSSESVYPWLSGRCAVDYIDLTVPGTFAHWTPKSSALVMSRNTLRSKMGVAGDDFVRVSCSSLVPSGLFVTDHQAAWFSEHLLNRYGMQHKATIQQHGGDRETTFHVKTGQQSTWW